MESVLARSLFVRPNNILLTHMLQTLSVARHVARVSGHRMTRFRVPREPDQQRILNFASITMESVKDGQNLLQGQRARKPMRIPFNSRAATSYTSLMYDRRGSDVGIGLVEVAPLVGLSLGTYRSPEDGTGTTYNTRIHPLILAPVEETVKEEIMSVEVKMERRQTSNENYRQRQRQKRLQRESAQARGRMTPLESSLRRFKGFGNRIRLMDESL